MKNSVIEKLVALNREFYQTFTSSFSATRSQVQPGVKKIAAHFPKDSNILDVGCGNGNLMQVLQKNDFRGTYAGVDFSENLIRECQRISQTSNNQLAFQTKFDVFDLALSDWNIFPIKMDWDVICAFAVFHHIPGKHTRSAIFRQIRSMLKPEAEFVFSVWQPQNSSRLTKRFLVWDQMGLQEIDVEEGDYLLDWRAEQSSNNKIGFRYVHIFNEQELKGLAAETGFSISNSFYSDGKEGNVGLYQVWKKKSNPCVEK
ncbi:MAG: class I SAM-dependent methyltransferase [Chloroflexi bacterium]|nr:class I SAM-dependent methyltransferase [Chloroflexota bacterium]